MNEIKRYGIGKLKTLEFMGIANRFLTFFIFFVMKGSADVDAVVWDRAGFQALSYKRCVSE
jgi:hypothetical protein